MKFSLYAENKHMIRNYLITALRNLRKNKGFTAINILGLALGLAVCMLIVLYVLDDLNYDRYNLKASRIYRVNEDLKLGNNRLHYAVCMAPLAQTLKNDFPDVEDAARLKNAYGIRIKKGRELIQESRVLFADASVFDVFTLPMIYGNPANALKAPNSIVLTESTALKYFDRTDAVGQDLILDDNQHYKITGVIKDIPRNSHFAADFLISMATFPDSRSASWLQSNYNTYVLLRKGANPKKLASAFPSLLRKYSGSELQSAMHVNYDEWERSGSFFRLNLIPLTDIHLGQNITGELGTNVSVQYIYILSTIALFILVIACVNFMNLSTARSSRRALEVGVRKVLGSTRKFLIGQFLTESILLTFIATSLALIFVLIAFPSFSQLSGKNLIINASDWYWLSPVLLLTILVVGILAGSYPAFFLSGFKPIEVVKGKILKGVGDGFIRNFLVVFQFSISIFLIIGSLVMQHQLGYIEKKDLGYNRNQVLMINNAFELGPQAQTLKNEIRKLPGVVSVTKTSYMPTPLSNRGTSIFYKEAVVNSSQAIFPQAWSVDGDYIPTLDMKITSGRNFSSRMLSDSTGLILNEAAVRFLGIKNPVGKTLYKAQGDDKPLVANHIIGIVKDFNFNSLRDQITPLVLVFSEDNGALGIKLKAPGIHSSMIQIESKWKEMSKMPIQYSFMDAAFDASYRADQQLGQIVLVFTVLAIVIACMGLLGLSAFAAERRSKEISIRKVLGAEVTSIVAMLSKDFVRLILIAILIATPIAWLVMKQWLQGFAYHQEIQWWMLVVSGLSAIVIALITISTQAIKAAIANPIDSLRNE